MTYYKIYKMYFHHENYPESTNFIVFLNTRPGKNSFCKEKINKSIRAKNPDLPEIIVFKSLFYTIVLHKCLLSTLSQHMVNPREL